MKASEIEAMFHLINWATEQLPMGGKKPQSLVEAEFAFHNSTGKWPREVTAKTLGSIVKANAAGSSAPACSHVPVSAEDVVMKFWNDNRITLKERTDYFRWINAENERRANKVITEKST